MDPGRAVSHSLGGGSHNLPNFEDRENRFNFTYIYIFLNLFFSALVLCCCARAFSSCGERGLLFVAVHGLLTAVASLVAEHGL